MPNLPTTFIKTSERVIASYSFTDIASGIGYSDFYLTESQTDAATDHHLITSRDYSNSASISANQATTDTDFDTSPFILPRTIDGTAFLSLAVHGTSDVSPTYTMELYIYDGSSETLISNTAVFDTALTAAKMFFIPLVVDNKIIKKGETLRLRVQQANPSSTTAQYGIDPANRTDGSLTITTTSKVSIPFRVDL